ncbi:MAG: hypothetical protein KDD69_14550 [Bdellovibrionales bacterium]|nr:hypothetical protein [Bdellovibrionales bacterium]
MGQHRSAAWEPSVRWTLALLTGIAFLLFAYIQQGTPAFIGTDAYYHVKLAERMLETPITAWPVSFPWLPRTVLSESRFSDHHFLFHVALIPFVHFGGLLATKWAAVLFATTVFVAFQLLVPPGSTAVRIYTSVAFFLLSPAFLYRMSMVRAQSLSLALLLVLVWALLRKRHFLVGGLTFLYVWLYNAFPLVLILLACYTAALWIEARTWDRRAFVAIGAGLLLGILVNPYFPQNVIFLFHHLIDKFQIGGFAVRVGREWYPYGAKAFLVHLGPSVLLLAGAVAMASRCRSRLDAVVGTLLLLALVTGVMAFRSRRFVELFPVFAVLSSAWMLQQCALTGTRTERASVIPVVTSLLLLSLLAWKSVEVARSEASDAQPYNRYRTSAEWLARHSTAGELVITADWDDFPRLFHFNHHNRYLAGLDPYFLYAADPVGFKLWKAATSGSLKETPGAALARRFESRWLFLDRKHERFRKALAKDPNARLAFDGGDSYVYEVRVAR